MTTTARRRLETARRDHAGPAALRKGGRWELVGRTEAAEIIGVARTNLTTLVGLPAPVIDYLKAGNLWLRRDIERFARRRNARESDQRRKRGKM